MLLAICLRGSSEGRDRLANRALEIHSSFLRKGIAELVTEDLGLDLLDHAFLDLAELEWPEGQADQPVYLQAEMFKDALHLAVLAFAQSQRNPRIVALHTVETGL